MAIVACNGEERKKKMTIRPSKTKPWAEKVRSLRKELGLNQRDFAAALEVKQQAVSSWEMGVYPPAADAYIALGNLAASVKNVDPLWFWQQAGFDLSVLAGLLPKLRKRIAESASKSEGDTVRIPLLRTITYTSEPSLAPPEEVEAWLAFPSALIPNSRTTSCIRVADVVEPLFAVGDFVLIDSADASHGFPEIEKVPDKLATGKAPERVQVIFHPPGLIAVNHAPRVSWPQSITRERLQEIVANKEDDWKLAEWFLNDDDELRKRSRARAYPFEKSGVYIGWLRRIQFMRPGQEAVNEERVLQGIEIAGVGITPTLRLDPPPQPKMLGRVIAWIASPGEPIAYDGEKWAVVPKLPWRAK